MTLKRIHTGCLKWGSYQLGRGYALGLREALKERK
jgi:hypothetical protein